MTEVTEQTIRKVLSNVQDPDQGKDIVSLGFIQNIASCGGSVKVTIQLNTAPRPAGDEIRRQAHTAIAGIEGVQSVNVELKALAPEAAPPPENPSALEGKPVKNVIAVTSGKGGVGKSTCAVNLAAALTATGHKVGLLDADIYGPNIPVMMGLSGRLKTEGGNKIIPKESHGIKTISIGYLVEDGTPIMWRGPMLHKALEQFFKDVEWGELDFLIVDMPPGTGDAQISLAQLVPLSGAVVITMPQEVSLTDVRRAIGMCQQVKCPILGVAENMSGDIFGQGGGEKTAEHYAVPFLGSIPLEPSVRKGGDSGIPIVVAEPDSETSHHFKVLAENVLVALEKRKSLELPVLQ